MPLFGQFSHPSIASAAVQAFSARVQQVAGGCDALDAVLLLRGLAAAARDELQTSHGATPASGYCGWQRGELADLALRRYTVRSMESWIVNTSFWVRFVVLS